MSTSTTSCLALYLQDHRGGATSGSELAEHAAEEHSGTELGAFFRGLARDIDEDVQTLEALMDRLGVEKSLVKDVGAWVGQKFSRLKMIADPKPLSALLEIETLRGGVTGKLALWQALLEVADAEPRLDRAEIERLEGRAQAQLDGLRVHHANAAREALTE